MKLLRYVVYGVIATSLVGCASLDVNVDDQPANPGPGKPTVPLKRRPIVPTTKLPRPRVIDKWWSGGALSMVLAPDVQSVRVVVTDTESGEVTTYMFDTREVELYALPESKFEVVVEVDGEVESFVVE